jgi:BclB C-terminal domain-containing protein
MKTRFTKDRQVGMHINKIYLLFTLVLLFCILNQSHAQVGVGTTTPHASAQLDVSATNKGVLIPRMDKAERDLIQSPATGLLIFQNYDIQTREKPGFYYYNGTEWQPLASSTIIPIASGKQFTLTTKNSGGSGKVAVIGFGTSESVDYDNFGSIDLVSSSVGHLAFSTPRSGTIESISAEFIGGHTFLDAGININITAQLYKSHDFWNTFHPVGATVDLGSFVDFIQMGTLRKGITKGLNISVNAQDRFILVFSATSSGTSQAVSIAGSASAGISIR